MSNNEIKLDEELDMDDPKVQEYIKEEPKEEAKDEVIEAQKEEKLINEGRQVVRKHSDEVAKELDIDRMGGSSADLAAWEDKFDSFVSENVSKMGHLHKKCQKAMTKIKLKNWFNKFFRFLHIKIRISTRKDEAIISASMKTAFLDCFLHLNDLDDASVKAIEEMRKDRSVEGILKQRPSIDFNWIEKRVNGRN